MNIQDYSIKNLKRTVSVKNEPVMAINISYPVFDPKAGEFCEKINKFYAHTAEKYTGYISEKYSSRAAKIYNSNGHITLAFVMSCTISYAKNGIISVFSDLSYFDGKKKKTVRFAQNWSQDKSAILPSSFCFDKSAKAKRYVTEILSEIAAKNIKNGVFSYYSDFPRLIAKKFDFDNFYFVPNGTAFFYSPGILSDEDTPCVFIVPNNRIDGVLKIKLT